MTNEHVSSSELPELPTWRQLTVALVELGPLVRDPARPESIDQLLAMEDPSRREREGGERFDRSTLPPRRRGNGLTIDLHAEAAEEKDAGAALLHPPIILSRSTTRTCPHSRPRTGVRTARRHLCAFG